MTTKSTRKPVIGLVGGIGAGKSSVAAALARHGGKVVAGDPLGHEALEQPEILDRIADALGRRDILTKDGEGRSQEARQGRLPQPGRTQPTGSTSSTRTSRSASARRSTKAQADPAARFVVLDAAVMLEAGWDDECDKLIYVDAPRPVRLARVHVATRLDRHRAGHPRSRPDARREEEGTGRRRDRQRRPARRRPQPRWTNWSNAGSWCDVVAVAESPDFRRGPDRSLATAATSVGTCFDAVPLRTADFHGYCSGAPAGRCARSRLEESRVMSDHTHAEPRATGRPGRRPSGPPGDRPARPPTPAERGRLPRLRRGNQQPLRGDQARRHVHHRAAADDACRSSRRPPRTRASARGVHRPQEAGPDLQDPQGAGQAERPDVRRGHARSPARRLRLPPQPRLQLPALPRRHLHLAEPDPPLRPAHRGASSPARSARPRRTSATSRCCASRRSTTRTPTCSRRRSSSTT